MKPESYIVKLERPENMTVEEMEDYIEQAVARHHEGEDGRFYPMANFEGRVEASRAGGYSRNRSCKPGGKSDV